MVGVMLLGLLVVWIMDLRRMLWKSYNCLWSLGVVGIVR